MLPIAKIGGASGVGDQLHPARGTLDAARLPANPCAVNSQFESAEPFYEDTKPIPANRNCHSQR